VSGEGRSGKPDKRAQIIEIAQKLFFDEGYAGASMARIAAELGGSKTTLYNHFQSKEDLLMAVVQNIVRTKPGDYDERGEPQEFRAWLQWFGTATLKRISSHDYVALQRLAAAEASRFPEIGRAFNDAIRPGYEMAAERFADAMAGGRLRQVDPRIAVENFLELCSGWMLRRAIWNVEPLPSDAQIDANVRQAVTAFMDGYKAPTQGP
jgi:AcrR family transcriptional regulator